MKRFNVLLVILAFSGLAKAQENKFTGTVGMTYNVVDFNWSIAGDLNGQSPNILSELNFKNIKSIGYFVKGTYQLFKGIKITGYYETNEVVGGHGTDIDYKEDNRTNPNYEFLFSSNKGELNNFKGGFKTTLKQWELVNLSTGLSYRSTTQNFHLLSEEAKDLKSTYKAGMKGVEISLEAELKLGKRLYSTFAFDGAYIRYNAIADWNLQGIFMHPVSFSQHANGISRDYKFELVYDMNTTISITLGGVYSKTNIFKGVDKSFLVTNTQVSTQFNGAKYNRYSPWIGLKITL